MKSSRINLNQELEDACEFLRSFTLGRRGFSQQDGVAAIARVENLCERLQEGSGSKDKDVVRAVTVAKGQILAAKARLELLRR